MEVASQCGKHVASSTDEAHKSMRELMTNPNHTEEDRAKWFKSLSQNLTFAPTDDGTRESQ